MSTPVLEKSVRKLSSERHHILSFPESARRIWPENYDTMQQIRGKMSHRESNSSEHTTSTEAKTSFEQLNVQYQDKSIQTDKHRCYIM